MYIGIAYGAMNVNDLTEYNRIVLSWIKEPLITKSFVVAGKPLSKCRPVRDAVFALSFAVNELPKALISEGITVAVLSEKQSTMFTKINLVTREIFDAEGQDWDTFLSKISISSRHAFELDTSCQRLTQVRSTQQDSRTITFTIPSVLGVYETVSRLNINMDESSDSYLKIQAAGDLNGQPLIVLRSGARVSTYMSKLSKVCDPIPTIVEDSIEGKLQDQLPFFEFDDNLNRWARTVVEGGEVELLMSKIDDIKERLHSLRGGDTDDVATWRLGVGNKCRTQTDLDTVVHKYRLCSDSYSGILELWKRVDVLVTERRDSSHGT